MRLRSFTAQSMDEAMAQVRQALGDDAVIVSSYTGKRGRGVVVVAAKDDPKADQKLAIIASGENNDPLEAALAFHGVLPALARRIRAAADGIHSEDPVLSLAGAFDGMFAFEPLPVVPDKPIVLIGAPGSGKTVLAAKLAARAVLAGLRAHVVTTDTVRAGAVAQLAAFTDILKTKLERASTPEDLKKALDNSAPNAVALIDTPGTGPFTTNEIKDLKAFIDAADVEPILVQPAGKDAAESGEAAAAFATLGIKRMIVTKLDVSRRLGGVLAAADQGGLSFAGVSVSPFVAQGVGTLNPVSLARLVLRDPLGAATITQESAAE
jgi:flagellar biosynthesis protein FlhF